jgi:ribosome-associated heat shock protein Hsp15
MRARPDSEEVPSRVRFDKWLWAARFYKTRSLASQAIEAGQARIAGERVKAAHPVRAGERIVLRRAGLIWDIVVVALAERRGGAADAAKLYTEAPDSAATRETEIARRKAAATSAPVLDGRPTKRDRRLMEKFADSADEG